MKTPPDISINGESLDDLIFTGHKLLVVRLLIEQRGCTFSEAMDALFSRYKDLRASCPDCFSVDYTAYWEGFHS